MNACMDAWMREGTEIRRKERKEGAEGLEIYTEVYVCVCV